MAGGIIADNIVRWDGAQWSLLGTGVGSGEYAVLAMARSGSDLIVGGGFTRAGSTCAARIARWADNEWHAYGSGLNHSVYAALKIDDRYYLGGLFGGGCVRWTGQDFEVLGAGLDSFVEAMCSYRGQLVVGGYFTRSGNTTINHIAAWNGHDWEPLGDGADGRVRVLAVYNDELYAGGDFATIGGSPIARIARWNGTAWRPLGSGIVGNDVRALQEYQGELYAGGTISRADGILTRIAKWNGTSWSSVGSGTMAGNSAAINAFEVFEGSLLVGGSFTQIGGVQTVNLARWNGSAWSAFAHPPITSIESLTVHEGALVAGGTYLSATPPPPDGRLARWTGSQWVPIGGGLSDDANYVNVYYVDAIASELVVGGDFNRAGDYRSDFFVRWTSSGTPAFLTQPADESVQAGDSAVFSFELAPGYDDFGPRFFQWYHNDSPVSDGPGGASPGGGSVAGAQSDHLTIESCQTGDAGEYFCHVTNDCGESETRHSVLDVAGPFCPADFDGSGVVNSQDFFQFLSAFFSFVPSADFNDDGVINSVDFFDFLAAFFAGC
jgi:hypothetical protein